MTRDPDADLRRGGVRRAMSACLSAVSLTVSFTALDLCCRRRSRGDIWSWQQATPDPGPPVSGRVTWWTLTSDWEGLQLSVRREHIDLAADDEKLWATLLRNDPFLHWGPERQPPSDPPLSNAGRSEHAIVIDHRRLALAAFDFRYSWLRGRVVTLDVPTELPAIVFGVPPLVWEWKSRRRLRRRQRAAAGRCAGCGYDLRKSPSHCPGCGAEARLPFVQHAHRIRRL